MSENKKPLIVLSGPTAVGKTDLSIKLAKALDTEIISADSMQVYEHMDIGTAKIMPDEMMGIKHHLIDIITPFDEWNVMKFKELSMKAINEIHSKNRIPIIAGGTGFYIQALLKDVNFEEESDNSVRSKLEQIAVNGGTDELYNKLQQIDPDSAMIIHKNNVKRVIRALEFYELNGYPISKHNKEQNQNYSPFNYLYIVLTNEREILYERIDKRIDIMVENGLVEEVKKLKEMGLDKSYVSMQGLGYKEILEYLNGECTLEEAIYILKRDTRHFAKRQLTWFRREKDVIFINKKDYKNDDEIKDYILKLVDERLN